MTFTPAHAKLVLQAFANVDIKGGDIKLFEALMALHELAESGQKLNVFLHIPGDRPVEGIKMARLLTGWGLKEARDWLDETNPNRVSGTYGPLMTVDDGGAEIKRILDGGGASYTQAFIRVIFEPVS